MIPTDLELIPITTENLHTLREGDPLIFVRKELEKEKEDLGLQWVRANKFSRTSKRHDEICITCYCDNIGYVLEHEFVYKVVLKNKDWVQE